METIDPVINRLRLAKGRQASEIPSVHMNPFRRDIQS
jgi:hypothetical protein